MQNLSPKPSKAQQSSKNKKGLLAILTGQAEFSKKMAIFDTIYYIVFATACIILACIWPAFAAICPDLVTIFTTGLITLRLGYTAKAGLENLNKIRANFKAIRNSEDDEEDENYEEIG